MPSLVIERPQAITPRLIDLEIDPFVRRCMIEAMTSERFVAQGGADRVGQDETGTLWRKVWWNGDAWSAVEVINGSPEPDGSYRHYFLQVPPEMRTARAAVAWTYGMSEERYAKLDLRT